MYSILIADDEPIVLKRLSTYIDWEELKIDRVFTAVDGSEALRLIEEANPDIIISDVAMPRMDGITLLKTIRESQRNNAVILISGYAEFQYVKEAMDYGCMAYVLKPVKEEELKKAVLKAIEQIKLKQGHEKWMADPVFKQEINNISAEYESEHMIDRVLTYLNENYQDSTLSSRSVAEYFYLNPSYFSRLFSQRTGKRFTQYLAELRLTKAEYLILNTNMKFVDIAKLVGFGSERYFYKIYKEFRRSSPSQLRDGKESQ